MAELSQVLDFNQRCISILGAERDAVLRVCGKAPPLMDHQDAAVTKALHGLVGGGTAGVVCVPTGGGKTRIGAEVAVRCVVERDHRVLWLSHKVELAEQAVAGVASVAVARGRDFRIGRFQADPLKVDQRVDCVVGSTATLCRVPNLDKMLRANPRFDLIVVDECHHTVARTWIRLVAELRRRCPEVRLLGLSATPFRNDNDEDRRLRAVFQNVVFHETSPLELIEAKVLARPRFWQVDSQDASSFSIFAHLSAVDGEDDFSEAELGRIAEIQARNDIMVKTFLSRRPEWGQTVFFACTIRHCEEIAKRLELAGVRSVRAVHGDQTRMSKQERSQAIDDFKGRQLTVLVSSMLLTEGTDLPKTGSVFMARPTRSPILFRQMVGRGLRGPRVGGTPECNVVVFEDAFQDQAADGFTRTLNWLAGLEGLEFVVEHLDDAKIEACLDDALRTDPVLVEDRRRKREALEDALRRLVDRSDLGGELTDRDLEGWWEIPMNVGLPLVLPQFKGLVGVQSYMESVAEAVAAGKGSLPWDAMLWSEGGWLIHARTYAFARMAFRHGIAPVWIKLSGVSFEHAFVEAAPGAHPDFEADLRFKSQDLLKDEVLGLARKRARQHRQSQSEVEAWRTVKRSDDWQRLAKRAEDYFDEAEWKALVHQAKADFMDALGPA